MNPITAALAGALISGAAMYVVGARATSADAFTPAEPTIVEGDRVMGGDIVVRPVPAPVARRPVPVRAATYTPAVVRTPVPVETPVAVEAPVAEAAPVEAAVVSEEAPERSWKKTAIVVGAGAASGAAVGGILDGKKGALIGAAIGGGAASVYEVVKRR